MHILIVDDNPADYRLFQALLKDAEHEPITFTHERRLSAALEKIKNLPIDLILFDLDLPDSQGIDTFHAIHQAAPRVPTVIMSKEGNEAFAEEAVRLGAQDYLIKGKVDGALLLRTMHYAIKRKRIEEDLRASEPLYRLIVDHAPVGVLIFDADSIILECNERFAQIIGTTRDRLINFNMSTSLENKHVLNAVRQALSGQMGTYEGPYTSVLAHKETVVHLVFSPIEQENGEISGGVGIVEDISNQKQAQEAVRASELRYRMLFETARDAIVILSTHGIIVDCNPAALELYHVQREDFIGKSALDFSPPYQPDGASTLESTRALMRLLMAGTPRSIEWRHTLPDGTVFDAEINLVRLDLPGGPFVQAIARNITNQRQARQELQNANRELALWVEELEKRNQQAILLNEMGNLLQSCLSDDEVYSVLGQYAERLFPSLSGAMYRFSTQRDVLDRVVMWGQQPPSEIEFPPEACWAMRRGRVHMVTSQHSQLTCAHLSADLFAPYLCVPLNAQGETFGLLYLREGDNTVLTQWEALSSIVAERVALALANLKLSESLRAQSIRDRLTGLLNRHFVEEYLEHEIHRANRLQTAVGLVLLDIDGFARYNQRLGHNAGNSMLREVGGLIRAMVRVDDLACRYNGEEFLVVLTETSPQEALEFARQMSSAIQQMRVMHLDHPLEPISVSIGVAVSPEHGLDSASLMRSTLAALMRAKATGGGQVCLAGSEE